MKTLNSGQRRGLVLLIVGFLLAAVAFVVAGNYTREVSSQVGDKVTVYKVNHPVPALTELTPSDVEQVEVPTRWLPPGAFSQQSFLGRKTSVDMQDGDYVTESMLVPAQDLKTGEREIAIMVDAEAGVGGRISQGDLVNVNATFEPQEGEDAGQRIATVLIRSARILSIGGETDRRAPDGAEQTVVPVTFALSEADSLKLLYGESFAATIRLSKLPLAETGGPRGGTNFTSDDVAREFGGGS